MKAEDLPMIFVLFYADGSAPKKFTYVRGCWRVNILDKYFDWQFFDNIGTESVLQEWGRSMSKFKLVWPEEYGE